MQLLHAHISCLHQPAVIVLFSCSHFCAHRKWFGLFWYDCLGALKRSSDDCAPGNVNKDKSHTVNGCSHQKLNELNPSELIRPIKKIPSILTSHRSEFRSLLHCEWIDVFSREFNYLVLTWWETMRIQCRILSSPFIYFFFVKMKTIKSEGWINTYW